MLAVPVQDGRVSSNNKICNHWLPVRVDGRCPSRFCQLTVLETLAHPEACAARSQRGVHFSLLHYLQRFGGFSGLCSEKAVPAVRQMSCCNRRRISRRITVIITGTTDALNRSLTDICTLLVRYLLILYVKLPIVGFLQKIEGSQHFYPNRKFAVYVVN